MSKTEASLSHAQNLPPKQESLDERFPEYFHTMQYIIEVPGEPSVHLRHVAYSDAEALIEVVRQNRESFATYLGWTADVDMDTMLMRIMLMLDQSESNEGMAYCIVQGTAENPGEVIGLNRLFNRYPSWVVGEDERDLTGPVAHCGFWIDKDARRQGIASRTCNALFQYAQKRWGIESIFMDVGEGNVAAERCVRAMGAIATRIAPWEAIRGDQIDLELSYLDPFFDTSANGSKEVLYVIERRRMATKIRAFNTIPMHKWLLRLPLQNRSKNEQHTQST